jgi:hypothetical protein
MVSTFSGSALESTVQTALRQGSLRRRDHLALMSQMLSDPALSPTCRSQINRLLDYIQMGRVQLLD